MLLYCQFDVHQTMHTDFLSQFDLRCTIFAFGVPHNSIKPHNRIYVLVRGSSKGAAQDRVENEIFGSRIWETLRTQFPDEAQFRTEVMSKVVAIQGDMSIDRLGLSEEDRATIQKDTTVFINSAASITFDGPLKSAFNVRLKDKIVCISAAIVKK